MNGEARADHGHVPRRLRGQQPREHHDAHRRPWRHGELQPVALHLVELQDHDRHAVHELPLRAERGATAPRLPPGAQTASAGATPFAGDTTSLSKTLGIFVEEAVAIRDRLFLTAAVANGPEQRVRNELPARLLSEGEPVVGDVGRGLLPALVVCSGRSAASGTRLAYGASGVQPGPNHRLPDLRRELVEHQGHRPAVRTVQHDRQRLAPARALDRVGRRLRLAFVRQPHPVRRDLLLKADARCADRARSSRRRRACRPRRSSRTLARSRTPGLELTARRPTARPAATRAGLPGQLFDHRQQGRQPWRHAAPGRHHELGGRGLSHPRSVRPPDPRVEGQERRRHPHLQRRTPR